MAGFDLTLTIEATPAEVFEFATDFDRIPEWIPQIVSLTMLTDGPLRAGSRFRETRRTGKRLATAEIEVIRHEGPAHRASAPYRHSAAASMGGVHATCHYRFVPSGSHRTRLTVNAEIAGTRLLARLFVPFLTGMMKREQATALARLKAAAEAAPVRV